MKTLKGTVLSNLSYTETKKLCTEYPTVFDCDRNLWREKAIADFGISGEFFDLVPQLSGAQRYLQIKSYHVLTPDLAVRVYEDGYIEGVYEAVAGFLKAHEIKDKVMEGFFASRLQRIQVRYIEDRGTYVYPQSSLSTDLIEKLNSPKREREKHLNFMAANALYEIKKGNKTLSRLMDLVESSRVDYLDQILHLYFTLPPGFSIQKDIPYTHFWAEEFPLYDLPPYTGTRQQELIAAAITSSDTRIVDFFRSILRGTIGDEVTNFYTHNSKGLELHKRPEEAFGTYKRFKKSEYKFSHIPMVEEILDLGERYIDGVANNLGNITTLQSLLPLFTKRDLLHLPFFTGKGEYYYDVRDGYPLSRKLVDERYKSVSSEG
nr:hypothetical protein Cduv_127 [Cedratvirus duvanny]